MVPVPPHLIACVAGTENEAILLTRLVSGAGYIRCDLHCH